MSGDYINPLPDGYEIGIAWSHNETIKFRMRYLKQALFVLQQASDPTSRLSQLMTWFDDADMEAIDNSRDSIEQVIAVHDSEQDPNAEIPSPVPAIIRQVRDHFWDRALNNEISQWEKRNER